LDFINGFKAGVIWNYAIGTPQPLYHIDPFNHGFKAVVAGTYIITDFSP
jgi:hypothetical protein